MATFTLASTPIEKERYSPIDKGYIPCPPHPPAVQPNHVFANLLSSFTTNVAATCFLSTGADTAPWGLGLYCTIKPKIAQVKVLSKIA